MRKLPKVTLVPDEAAMVAEDDSGASYNYGKEGFPRTDLTPSASDYLAVRTKSES